MKSTIAIILTGLLVILSIASIPFLMEYRENLKAQEIAIYFENLAWEITNSMPLEDKIGQVIHIAIPGKTLDKQAKEEIQSIKPGGIIHFGKNLGSKDEIKKLNQNLQEYAIQNGLPPFLISTDQEGGRVVRVQDGVTRFPGAMAIGQTNSEEIGELVGFITSYELRKLGINFLLAPILDINNNPENPVINTRSFGSDPERVTKVGCAYERGARKGGAIPVIKHFPGHGDTNVDSHLGLPVIQKSIEELERLELIPFQKAIQNGAPVVMTAHILYPQIDPDYPATLSPILLSQILREKLGFQGIIITDAMEMDAISKNYQNKKPAVRAIQAGADIILLTSYGDFAKKIKKDLFDAYQNGEFQKEEKNLLDIAVHRQIKLKLEYGIFTENAIPIIKNESVAEWFEKRQNERENLYKNYKNEPNLAYRISLETIRSFPEAYPTPGKEALESSYSFFKNPTIEKIWKENKGLVLPRKKLLETLKKFPNGLFVLDSANEKEFSQFLPIIQKYPQNKFIILHYGNPFMKIPKLKNLTMIFSFSNTKESLEALVNSLWIQEKIPKVELILP